MMSPGPSRSAAAWIAAAVPMPWKDAAAVTASGAMPVIPYSPWSPPITPMTAVPWLRQARSVSGVPTTTPASFAARSSCPSCQAPSTSITVTPWPVPPGRCQAQYPSMPSGAGRR